MDRLRAMSIFLRVADTGSFAEAARRLQVSPPSVTRAVSELESHLGGRLIHRTTRSVRLTEVGKRYAEDCRRIFADLEEADRQASGEYANPRGTVAITAPAMFGGLVLMPILCDLAEAYPDLVVTTLFIDRIANLVDEGLDVAVRIGELPDSSLSAVRVGTVRRVLCASPTYFAQFGRPRDPNDLADHAVIDFAHMAPGGTWSFRTGDGASSVRLESRLHVNTAAAAITAAAAGRGVTRLLSYMISDLVAEGRLEIVLDDHEPPAVPVHVLHKEPGRTSARVRATVDFLTERLRQEPVLRESRGATNSP